MNGYNVRATSDLNRFLEEKYKILTIDARELYDLSLIEENDGCMGYNFFKPDGKIDEKKFSSFLHTCLELEHLKLAYKRAKSSNNSDDYLSGRFEINRRHPVYIRKGEKVDLSTELKDHVCIRNGKLIAIELPCKNRNEGSLTWKDTYSPVCQPCDKEILDGYFVYDADKGEYACAKDKKQEIKNNFDMVKKSVDGEYPLTLAVINVVFKNDEKLFNKKKSRNGYVYVRKGNIVNFEKDLTDHVLVRDGKLIAIEVPYSTKKGLLISKDTYAPVRKAVVEKCLEGYFKYNKEKQCYVATEKKIPVVKKHDEIRQEIYKNGFKLCHDKRFKYVRYKRSAGSSREGNCLFILEPLYKYMMEWSACGLKLDEIDDIISKESYISLTLSNMKNKIVIPSNSILVIPDATSSFKDKVVSVRPAPPEKVGEQSERLIAEILDEDITNSIWDGQGLLDVSVFNDNHLEDKGMMLLRNRFLKTCAFNTNLQEWFKEKGITRVEQLNGYTEAKDIKDIKLVITDSSLKYIKLYMAEKTGEGYRRDDALRALGIKEEEKEKHKEEIEKYLSDQRNNAIARWLKYVDPVFGLVKTEMKTKHMQGRMVKTSYQLINTLDLTDDEVEALLSDHLAYLNNIQNDPMYMRKHLNTCVGDDSFTCNDLLFDEEEEDELQEMDGEDVEEDEDTEAISSMRKNVVLTLLKLNEGFAQTKEYSNFRAEIKKAYVRDLKRGHISVLGTNATLFGNGYEMLNAVVDKSYDFKNPKAVALDGRKIRISRFENGKELLCARSPHITMGNLFVGENTYSEDDVYSKYFNLTDEIVCVNSIGENLLQRLNGCDFDSDMMLVTDNPIMLKAASHHYPEFLVPYNKGESNSDLSNNGNLPMSVILAKIDCAISENRIGEIVNLSQILNSIFWNNLYKGELDMKDYYDICKLAVLSNMEIDKAKRNYNIKSKSVIDEIRAKLGKGAVKPEFLKYAKTSKSRASNVEYTKDIHTSMQLLTDAVEKGKKKSKRGLNMNLGALFPDAPFNPTRNDQKIREEIVRYLCEKQEELSGLRRDMFRLSDDEKSAKMQECAEIELECVSFVRKKMKNKNIMKLLVYSIDDNYKLTNKHKREDFDEKKHSTSYCRSLLLSCICNASTDFYNEIKKTSSDVYELIEDENGEHDIMGFKHSAVLVKKGNI